MGSELCIRDSSFIVENLPRRLMISDTDAGEGIKRRIEDLNALLDAYRSGTIKTDSTGRI